MKLCGNILSFFTRIEHSFLKRNFKHQDVEPYSLLYYRSRILLSFLIVSLLTGLLAYTPAFYLAVTQKLWGLLIIDTAGWGMTLILLLSPTLSFRHRSCIAAAIPYVIGLFIIIHVGPLSGGPSWLFAFAVIAGVLLGSKAALTAVIINAVTIIVMGWLASTGKVHFDFPFFQSSGVLITAGANFVFLNAVVAVGVSVLIKSLEITNLKEKILASSLKSEQLNLLEAKNRLELEVNERKQAQKHLQESRKRYHTLFESASDAILILQNDLKIIDCNLKTVNMFQVDKHAIIGSTPEQFSPEFQANGESSAKKIHKLLKLLHQKGSILFEWSHIKKNGTIFDVEVSLTLIELLARTHILAIIRDITQRKCLHDMMLRNEKMSSIGGLAAGMAHEINNPLAGIIQSIDVVLNRINKDNMANQAIAKKLDFSMDQMSVYFEKRGIERLLLSARIAGDKAAKIVSNMLSFSYQGQSDLELVDICELMDMTIELAQNDYDLKKNYDFRLIDIQKEYESNIPGVLCEKTKIQQVFFNLLKNGAHAMTDHLKTNVGNQKMMFSLRIKKTGPDICIEIEDNGPGMDDAIAGQIFEPFFTTKRVGVGTGLGLWVSYFIIHENHKGSITFESTPGQGSCFKILLPITSKNQSSNDIR
ncbi:MAG: PAS domain S-box protein [Desulfobacula sp.]|uniref:ATP-binding protein n=1 Tax=Desulfobacula sp. TaxID=2593537 RepID=UPI0025C34F6C|nr:ATP-binding protein [Desulfobacula sp.]MCD4718286.1 PAS domain S-box protein [Desulfobacula sp.]